MSGYMTTIDDARKVHIDEHRWYATITVQLNDGGERQIYVCADGEHSGLWLGDPADHVEH